MTNFKKYFNESQTSIASLVKINETISNNGGELYVVGGPVRDFLLGHEPKDIDFLVRKLTLSEIQKLLSTIGKTKEVGESFGIVKCVIEGNEYDFAIPRTKEEKTGDSHTDFNVSLDPFAPVEADLNRRDFSFNSMAVSLDIFIKCMVSPRENAIALLKQNIIDPNGGLEALEARKLKAVGNSISRFKEDPLRIMRAIQFSTRMGFEIEDGTKKAMRELSPLLKTVSGERIFEEIKKAWTKGKSDVELMIRLLSDIGADKVLFGEAFKPEFVNLNSLNSDERVLGYFVCFFINGGDYSILKVDNK
jgi:tRNA nucleotidyltransferase/poly(A) polymerase